MDSTTPTLQTAGQHYELNLPKYGSHGIRRGLSPAASSVTRRVTDGFLKILPETCGTEESCSPKNTGPPSGTLAPAETWECAAASLAA